MLQYRYIKSGNLYLPQYKKDEGEWLNFTDKTFTERSLLGRLALSLANLSVHPGSAVWYQGPQYFLEDGRLFFLEEHLVCAFLGAAKSVHSVETKEFNL